MSLSKKQKTKDQIVFLGESRFPFGLAAVQRMTLMAKALLYIGIKPIIICRKGSWNANEHVDFDYKGNFEGINYIYTSKVVHKPKGFLRRNIQKLKGIYGEYKYLKQLKRDGGISLAIVANRKLFHVIRYIIYSSYLNFPIALNLVEMASSMQERTNFFTKINDYLLDKYIIKLFDGALPISDKFVNYYKSVSPVKPNLKLPIICDFEKFNIQKSNTEPYFLYCGSFAYKEVINFVIEAYQSICDKEKTMLYMIVSGGTRNEINLFEQEINKSFKKTSIKLFSNIPYEELVKLYTNALALLIPLRPTMQDSSRFPHKIGEYLASGNPVITTNVGEIKNYFEDGKTALIADTYSIESFADKLQYVLVNPETARLIGSKGKEIGLKEFDYKTHGIRLKQFLQEISGVVRIVSNVVCRFLIKSLNRADKLNFCPKYIT